MQYVKTLLVALICSASLQSFSQAEGQWFYGTSQSDQGVSAIVSQDGGMVISANSYGGLLSPGSVQNFLIKVDSAGTIEWVHAADTNSSNETNIVVEHLVDSSFFVGAYTNQNALVNYPKGNVWFYNVDKNGAMVWSRVYAGDADPVNRFDEIDDVIRTSDGNFFAVGVSETGSYTTGNGAYEATLYKLDPSGNMLWARAIGTSDYEWGQCIMPTSDGNYLIGGRHSDLSTFDMYLVKIDLAGNILWANSYGGSGWSQLGSEFANYGNTRPSHSALTQTSDGGYVAVGHTDGYGAGGNDMMAFKVNSAGVLQWAYTFGNASDQYGAGVVEIPGGDLIIGGSGLGFGGSNNDIFLTRLTSAGALVWMKSYESTAAGGPNEYVGSIELAGDSGLILTGTIDNAMTQGNDILLLRSDYDGNADTCTNAGMLMPTNQTPTVTNITGSLVVTPGGAAVVITPVEVGSGNHGPVSITETELCYMPNPNPCTVTVDLGPDVSICAGSNVVLDAGYPGSTYLWNDLSTNQTLTVTATGTYYVDVITALGCTGSDTIDVTVNSLPTVTLNPFSDVCIDATPFALTGGSPAGGSYSGQGVSGGTFNPATAGAGTHTITYTYTDANSCTNSANQTITVYALPNVTLNPFADVCVDVSPFGLTGGSPAGGTYSGNGVSGGSFNPATAGVGTHTITYDYTDGNGCAGSASQTITVNSLPTATLNPFTDVCLNDAPFALSGGSPAGGNYSGPGVSGNNFDPAAAGPGTHTITYLYTDGNGCSDNASQSITVNAMDDPSFSFTSGSYCLTETDPMPTITGLPNGSFSGSAGLVIDVISGVIDLNMSGVGSFTATYTTNGPCPQSANFNITITPAPDATFSYTASPYCQNDPNDPTATLGAGATAGIFSATPVGLVFINTATGEVDLSASAPGTYNVTNTIAPSGGCAQETFVATIEIIAADDPSFNYSGGTFCQTGTDPIPTITGLNGGMFTEGTGNLIIDGNSGTIDLDASPLGSYTITYTTNGPCPESTSTVVTITTAPDATFDYPASPFCNNEVNVFPSFGAGASAGQFSSTPAGLVFADPFTGEINISGSAPGAYEVTNFIAASGGCAAATYTDSVIIIAMDNPGFTYASNTYCTSETDPVPTITGLMNGMFSEGTGNLSINSNTGEIDLSASTVGGPYTVTYLTNGPCPSTGTFDITITSTLDATITASGPYCADNASVTLTAANMGGQWTGNGITDGVAGTFDPATAGVGTHTITYTIPGVCGDTATSTIDVIGLDDPGFSYASNVFCVNDTNPLPSFTGGGGGSFTSSSGNLSINPSTGEIDIANSQVGGPYTITYVTNGMCPDSATFDVSISDVADATINATGPFCENEGVVTLSAVQNGGTWSGAGITDSIAGVFDPATAGAGTHTITYTIGGACGDSQTISLVVNQAPTADAGSGGTICSGDSLTLIASGGPGYAWNTGETTASITVSPAMSSWYTVTVTNADNCSDSDSVEVVVITQGSNIAFDDVATTEEEIPVTIEVALNDLGDPTTVSVVTNPLNGSADVQPDGSVIYTPDAGFFGMDSFTYVICDAFCTNVCDTATVVITVDGEVEVIIPNGISPNGDGMNETWSIQGIEQFPDNEVLIFNRWGDKVYEAAPYTNDWSGQNNAGGVKLLGDDLVEGTYFYILKLSDEHDAVQGYIELKK